MFVYWRWENSVVLRMDWFLLVDAMCQSGQTKVSVKEYFLLYFWLCFFFLLYSCQPLLTYHWDEAGIILCFEETTPSVVKDEHQPIRRKQLDESVICPWSGLKQSFLVNYINHNLKCAWMWMWNKFLEIIIFLSRAIPVKCPNKLTSLNSCVYCTDREFYPRDLKLGY